MDPLTAFGLVASIVQVVDFTAKIINGARQTYISGADASASDADVGTCALELDALCTRLETSKITPQTADEEALCRLANRCKAISQELSEFLTSIRAKRPDKKWQCLVSAVKSQLKRSQRDDLLARLGECRAQLAIQINRLNSLEQKTVQERIVRSVQANDNGFREVLDAIKRLQGNVSLSLLGPQAELQLRQLFNLPDSARRTITAGRILNLLAFESMHDRVDDIGAAHDETFLWAFDDGPAVAANPDRLLEIAETPTCLHPVRQHQPEHVYIRNHQDDSGKHLFDVAQANAGSSQQSRRNLRAGADQKYHDDRDRPSTSGQSPAQTSHREGSRAFTEWLRCGGGICHVLGEPNTGKSTFMKFLCSHDQTRQLVQQWAQGASHVIATAFLWRHGSKKQKSIVGLCRTLVWDILRQCPELTPEAFPGIWDIVEATPWQLEPRLHIGVELIQEALRHIFHGRKSSDPYCFCIFIDGIHEHEDENGDYDNIIDLLLGWIRPGAANVKLCITSRPDAGLVRSLDADMRVSIKDHTRHDLAKVVAHRLSAWHGPTDRRSLPSSNLGRFCTEQHGPDLVSFIVSRANGDFRWAATAAKSVNQALLDDPERLFSTDMDLSPLDRGHAKASNIDYDQLANVLTHVLDYHSNDSQATQAHVQSAISPRSDHIAARPRIPNASLHSNMTAEEDPDLRQLQMKELAAQLGSSDSIDDDLFAAEDERLEGTCEWFKEKSSYTDMIESASLTPKILWITGYPASGKSTMAAYIVNQLQAIGADVSFFFFKHADRSKSAFSACLKAIALQMARRSDEVRRTLYAARRELVTLGGLADSERLLWRKLFLDAIFQQPTRTCYWVIDGLDECSNPLAAFTSILGKIDRAAPLRIFITSRETPLLKSEFAKITSQYHLHKENIIPADTMDDIRHVAEAKAKGLPVKGQVYPGSLIEQVLNKSNGNFLWTVLVLKELSQAYTVASATRVLEEVPDGMQALYARTLETMSQMGRGKDLAKAVLSWTACLARPLTIAELRDALALDTGENVPSLEADIAALCGQLVIVDRSSHVRLIHETAREFLSDKSLTSEFAVNSQQAHTRIARTCLRYLSGSEMKLPRSKRRGSTQELKKRRSPFSAYACNNFTYHLKQANAQSAELVSSLNDFLKANILSWIEFMATGLSMLPVVEAAKDIKRFTRSCLDHYSPLTKDIQNAETWANDLVRMVARFADALVASPTAVFSLVPPFCPATSAIRKTVPAGRGLTVIGYDDHEWDDCLSSIDLGVQTRSLDCGKDYFAVGLSNGAVQLYQATTGQGYKTLQHGEDVTVLCFLTGTPYLASCGVKALRIWNVDAGDEMYTLEPPHRCLSLAYWDGWLLAACDKNYLARWQLGDKALRLADIQWQPCADEGDLRSLRPPSAVCISIAHKMIAIASPGRPIILWDLEENAYYGSCGKKLAGGTTSVHMITAVLFNLNSAIALLAASYLDGELAVIDPFEDHTLNVVRANCPKIASSHDGRFLAGAAGPGIIDIYDFETLKHVYRIRSTTVYVKELVFGHDSLTFLDIRGSTCSVWSPSVLQQAALSDGSSDDTTRSSSVVDVTATATTTKVTALALQKDTKWVLSGESNGSVSLFDVEVGQRSSTLYRHKSPVRLVGWWGAINACISVDISNSIEVWRTKPSRTSLQLDEQLLQSRLLGGYAITSFLTSQVSARLILSTREADHFWEVQGEGQRLLRSHESAGLRQWIQHPTLRDHAIRVSNTSAQIYNWSDWSQVKHLAIDIEPKVELKSVMPRMHDGRYSLLLELSELNGSARTQALYLLEDEALSTTTPPLETQRPASFVTAVAQQDTRGLRNPSRLAISTLVSHVIGFADNGRLVFIDKYSWVCSLALEQPHQDRVQYYRHFFLPYGWLAGSQKVNCALSGRNVLIARNDTVVNVKGGLDYVEELAAIITHDT